MQPNNAWDLRFSEPGFAYGVEPNEFLVDSAHYLPNKGSVLCLAEGEGRNGVWLASRGHDVTAIDSSMVGLQKARELADQHGVQINTIAADLADYLYPPSAYNGIVGIFCHLPPVIRHRLFGLLHKTLQKDGILILEGYSKRQHDYGTGGPPSADMLYDLQEITTELQGFNFLLKREVEREVVEGRLHTGLGSVVQIIARKAEP